MTFVDAEPPGAGGPRLLTFGLEGAVTRFAAENPDVGAARVVDVKARKLLASTVAEDQAEGGEIWVDEATLHAVGDLIQVDETREDCHRVTHVLDKGLAPVMAICRGKVLRSA